MNCWSARADLESGGAPLDGGSNGFNWWMSVKVRAPVWGGDWPAGGWFAICGGAVGVVWEISFSVNGTGLDPGC
jgi:hypothetical protein